MDPAVLAAHPMSGSLHQSQHTETSLMQQNFAGVSRLAAAAATEDSQSPASLVSAANTATHSHHHDQQQQQQNAALATEQLPVYDSMSVTQSQTHFVDSQAMDSAFNSQEYMSHGLQSGVASLHVDESSGLGQQMEGSGTSGLTSDATSAMQQMGGQNTQDLSAQNMFNQADMSQSKKPFTMNADAAVFQSMYSPQSQQGGAADEKMQQRDFQDSNMYNNSGFGRGGRGGQRGGRGGQRGAGGMSNGFPRGGSRGGSSGFNNRSQGYSNGRGSYQNYSNRGDYNRADSYQYNNGFSAGGFNKRGGGAPSRGSVRGGAMRGGSAGGSRGGPGARGGRGGGFGTSAGNRPQQQQQASA